MLKNYFILSVRRLKRDSFLSLINLLGLSIGLGVFIIISGYISFEKGFDSYAGSEKIFRVQNNYIRHGELIYNSASTFAGVGPYMAEYFSEVESYARFFPWGKMVNVNIRQSHRPEKVFRVKNLVYADNEIIELLNFNIIGSNSKDLLNKPNHVIISESYSQKLFGTKSPLGETLFIESEHGSMDEVEINGVFKDRPINTHAHFDVIVSYSTLYSWGDWRGEPARESFSNDMGGYLFHTYIRVSKPDDIYSISTQMQQFIDKYKPSYKEVGKNGERVRVNEFTFTNIKDIHLKSKLQNEYEVNGSNKSLNILGFTGTLILVLAWMNYINLYTARSIERAKEVGIRKSIGSSKRGLLSLFLTESFLINMMALVMAFTGVQVIKPIVEVFSGSRVELFDGSYLYFLLFAGTILILGTIISGLYPAIIISNYDPLKTLKGSFKNQTSGKNLRRGFVLIQFVISVGLSICTLGIYYQLNFMLESDYGFEKENILIIEKPALTGTEQHESLSTGFKEALRKYSNITSVGASDVIPGKGILRGMAVSRNRSNGEDRPFHSIEEMTVDPSFIPTYNLDMKAGRNFSSSILTDSLAMIINERAAEILGFDNAKSAVGETVYLYTRYPRKIIGVVQNYHHESFHMKIDPMFFQMRPETDFLISIRFQGTPAKVLEVVKKEYPTYFENQPLQYYFLDDFFGEQYNADMQFLVIFQGFTILALLIAALGLFGLVVFSVSTNIKEFGIRKILGALGYQLMYILGREFLILLLIGSVVAIPFSYLWLGSWLQSFAYQVKLNFYIFLIPVISVFVICLLVIISQIHRVMKVNPVDVLRYE